MPSTVLTEFEVEATADALLPKLMSGEIRVGDAEEFAAGT